MHAGSKLNGGATAPGLPTWSIEQHVQFNLPGEGTVLGGVCANSLLLERFKLLGVVSVSAESFEGIALQ